jgi:hypothetical protein
MFQVAIGGYNTSPNTFDLATFIDPATYREPGGVGSFIGEPLTFSDIDVCDQLYLLIRKRGSVEGTFEEIDYENLSISVTDVTNGMSVPAFITINSSSFYHADWNGDSSVEGDGGLFNPVIGVITNCFNYLSPVSRIRAMDCMIKEIVGTDFIYFRLLVNDTGKNFNYIIVDVNNMSSRENFSSQSREAIIKMGSATDLYMLFSPYAYLKEVDSSAKYDFSYPLGSVYYKRQETFNNEGYEFSLVFPSHSWISENMSLINVPGCDKAAAVLIDKHIFKYLATVDSTPSINFKITGKTSEIVDYFKVYLGI